MSESIAALIAAIIIIVLSRVLKKYFSVQLFAATELIAIAFIYVGFSLKENPAELIILECAMALVFFFIALIGYTRNSSLIAIGIILHGIWDVIHHNGLLVKTDMPGYWPVFCIIIDVINGFYFLYVFHAEKKNLKNGSAGR